MFSWDAIPPAAWAIAAAIVGATLAWLLNSRLERARERRALTAAFAKEYLSVEFIPIRASVGAIIRLLAEGKVDISSIAAGYWFPGRPGSFVGVTDSRSQLTQHESLTVYLDFYKRLGYAIERGLVDLHDLGLLADLAWTVWLASELCDEIERQADEDGREAPDWLPYVRAVIGTVPFPRGAAEQFAQGWLGPDPPVIGAAWRGGLSRAGLEPVWVKFLGYWGIASTKIRNIVATEDRM